MTETSSEYVNRIAKEYAIYVLDTRGIPSMYDGMKTVQRIALWLMRSKAGKIKTKALAGEMISSELYVHGDEAGSDAISQIAAKWKNNNPLLEGIGGFGSKGEPGAIGAARYTYVKRNTFAEKNLYVDMPILPMVENHDGSNTMPGTFLPIIPLVLLNGVRGVATGWSTHILPHKYEDLIQAVVEVIETGKVQKKLMPYYRGYDFDITEESPNRYIVKGRAKVKNTSTVIVTELLPEMTLEAYRDKLAALESEGKITGFTDRSKKTIDIEVKFQRAVLSRLKGDKLLEYLKLRTYITERIVVLGLDGVRHYEQAEELVQDWVAWRLGWYERRFEYLRDKAENEELFWRSFVACYEGVDGHNQGIPECLRKINDRTNLKKRMEFLITGNHIPLDDDIVERLANLPIYRWTKDENQKAKREAEAAAKRATSFERIRKDPTKHRVEFKKDLLALKG